MKALVFLILFIFLGGLLPVYSRNMTSPEFYLAQVKTEAGNLQGNNKESRKPCYHPGAGRWFRDGERNPSGKYICVNGKWVKL